MYSPEPFRPTGKEIPFGDGRFLLSHRLGGGSFGDIYEGYDTERRERVAVKLEKKKTRFPQLQYESRIYRALYQPIVDKDELQAVSNMDSAAEPSSANARVLLFNPRRHTVVGIPKIYYFASEGDYNILVMEMCGPSLEDLFNYCHRRFSLKTVLMIADQIIHRMQFIHDKGFVHRDVKPENFIFGVGLKSHILHVIDFGLSKLYWDIHKNVHMPFAEGKSLTGTTRYCSANTHRGYEQSRRDDLESIGFLFVYFLKGSLPWQGIQARDQQLKTIRIGEKKIATPLEELCKGLPSAFLKYSRYCRELSFQERPDYDYLRKLFRDLGRRCGFARKPELCPESRGTMTTSHGTSLNGTTESHTTGSYGLTQKNASLLCENDHGYASRMTINKSNNNVNGGAAAAAAISTNASHEAAIHDMTNHTTTTTTTGGGAVVMMDGHTGNKNSVSEGAAMVSSGVYAPGIVHPPLQIPSHPAFVHDELDTEAETCYGFYDWDFDWLQKRVLELNGALPKCAKKNAIDKRSVADSTQGPTSDANQSKN